MQTNGFRTTAETRGEGLDPLKLVYWPFQGGSSVVVHHSCIYLCIFVVCWQCGHHYNWPHCFL